MYARGRARARVTTRPGGALFPLLVCILLVAGLAAVLVATMLNNQASLQIDRLQARADQLSQRQQELSVQLQLAQSPVELASRAKGMGMVPPRHVVWLSPSQVGAQTAQR